MICTLLLLLSPPVNQNKYLKVVTLLTGKHVHTCKHTHKNEIWMNFCCTFLYFSHVLIWMFCMYNSIHLSCCFFPPEINVGSNVKSVMFYMRIPPKNTFTFYSALSDLESWHSFCKEVKQQVVNKKRPIKKTKTNDSKCAAHAYWKLNL